jgi:hypothetical protein
MALEQYSGIQLAVDHLLGAKSTIRRKKRTQSDRKKETFFLIVTLMEETIVRSNIAYHDLQLDLFKYEEKFMQVIDMLMFFGFGEEAVELISFYLYDRLSEDGKINPIKDSNGHDILLENPYQLWDLIVQINPKINS